MRHPRLMWLAFAAAAAVVLASMGWVTAAVLRLDAAEAESRRRAQLEENVRLALWRMDSALAPLIAAEHARPVADADASSTRIPGTEKLFVHAYFRVTPADSPEKFERLAAILPPPAPPLLPEPDMVAQLPSKGDQAQRNAQEYQARAANTMQQVAVQSDINRSAFPAADDIPAGLLRPLWSDDDLILARRVAGARRETIQGCRIDWPAARSWLLESVKDLLPSAQLLPVQVEETTSPSDARLLASLPVRLEPGPLPVLAEAPSTSPLRVSLVIAWGCVLTATTAVGLLLAGVASLSERRGAFVSAVTHELRTPLTTLRMYTEMLAEGMVADESQRRGYLQTLRAEADRLGHLVENVLAYSRLERKRAAYEVAPAKLGDLLARIADRLRDRARQAGMEWTDDVTQEVRDATVCVNALALEQILFNLVDNACKYASSAADKRIELGGRLERAFPGVELYVRDHGPGIPSAKAPSLFRPFSKSVHEAADTAPGLGLGLAISRRLARSMRGELTSGNHPDGGAVFTVHLAS